MKTGPVGFVAGAVVGAAGAVWLTRRLTARDTAAQATAAVTVPAPVSSVGASAPPPPVPAPVVVAPSGPSSTFEMLRSLPPARDAAYIPPLVAGVEVAALIGQQWTPGRVAVQEPRFDPVRGEDVVGVALAGEFAARGELARIEVLPLSSVRRVEQTI